MAKKYYAVRKGVVPGIYMTWDECKKNVDGFSGAEYKSFPTLAEAEAFMKLNAKQPIKENAECTETTDELCDTKDSAVAYVDGSYHNATKEYSYGAVLFYDGKEEHYAEKFQDPERAKMRNVAGEIEGSMTAMRYCLAHKIPSLTIYYDYEGIEKWCTGVWQANKEGTIAYRDFYLEAKKNLQVKFVKVKGHSGDKYNDLADKLAKQALGL